MFDYAVLLAATLVIEASVALGLALAFRLTVRRDLGALLGASLCADLMTHPFAFQAVTAGGLPLGVAEVVVTLLEAVALGAMLRTSWALSSLLALARNLVSAGTGVLWLAG